VIARHLKASVLSVFRAAADRIRRAGEAEERTLEILKKLRSDDDGSLDEDHIRASASMALGEDPADDDLEAIATVVSRSFRRRSALRVCRLAAGVFILVTLLTYILAWAAVPLKVAAKWVCHAIPVEHVRLVGFDAALPVGAYIGIALLLAIVATAGFLAFALTEDRYSEALSDAVTHRPAEEGLLLALPYHAITDQSTSASRQRGHGGDESRGRRAA
jgi:hypothetical protein